MKTAVTTTLLAAVIGYTVAAPAIVWRTASGLSSPLHSSEVIQTSELFASAVTSNSDESSLVSVIFLVSRDEDGTEALTRLASIGALPEISSKYGDATEIYHYVEGIESSRTVARDARASGIVMEVKLNEFTNKLTSLENTVLEAEVSTDGIVSKTVKAANKRARALSAASILVVNVSGQFSAAGLDSAVKAAINCQKIGSVVLTAVRSTDEVKLERNLAAHRRVLMQSDVASRPSILTGGRRRLEDQQAEDGADNNDNPDMTGVYYVNLTPNIFSGVLFFFLFTFVAYTGISCMGMIAGQDVYTDKLPAIGREA